MILKSWKEIADFLRCGVRTAQRWEEEMGLPIRRPGRDRHVVLAFTEELNEWIAQGTPSCIDEAQQHATRQIELKHELRELRAKQKQLAGELRATVKRARESPQGAMLGHPQAHHSPSLLTVDDNPVQGYAMSQILRHAGFTVYEAHDADEAIKIAQRERPGLVLMDIHLHDFNGYELFALLRQNPQTKAIAVIFYTALSPSNAASYVAEQLGADGFIESSADPNTLVTLVQRTISRTNLSGLSVKEVQ